MVLKLLQFDEHDAQRYEIRLIDVADGDRRFIAAKRVTWRWFDHLQAYEFCPPRGVILDDAIRHAADAGLHFGDALGAVVASYVDLIEREGGDVTDDDIDAVIAAKVVISRCKPVRNEQP